MPIEISSDTIADAIVNRLMWAMGALVPRLLTLDQAATYSRIDQGRA